MAGMKSFNNVKMEKKDGIGWVILNRPEKRNAMSPALHSDMNEALDIMADDDDVKVVVLTGAGEAWCAGQDLALYFRAQEGDAKARERSNKISHEWRWNKLVKFPKPTIAMVNGYCFGGAFTQLCACDFAIASNTAIFGLSEVNWGIIPGGIVSWNAADVLSYRDALYYAVTGDPFDGKQAEKIRLVNYSVPKSKLRAETIKLAKKLMTKSPNAIRFTKDAVRAVRRMGVEDAQDYLAMKGIACKATDKIPGRDEGMRQFLDEKSYRPGLGQLDLKTAAKRGAAAKAKKAPAKKTSAKKTTPNKTTPKKAAKKK
jgi:trans-feruloyl-CoA hydratase/vanillin synthase